eukprot:6527821-Prymnesium_polylepis.2
MQLPPKLLKQMLVELGLGGEARAARRHASTHTFARLSHVDNRPCVCATLARRCTWTRPTWRGE